MSLIVNTFAMVFILGQFYGFLFRPSYNQTIATNYISKKDAEVYTVPLKTFLPVFAILSNQGEKIYDYLEMGWYQGDFLKIDIIDCKELVNTWTDISEGERQSILDELDLTDDPDAILKCPNATSFQLSSYAQNALDNKKEKFRLVVKAIDATVIDLTTAVSLYSSEISRYFNAEDFAENGYQEHSRINSIQKFFVKGKTVRQVKRVARTEVSYYPFRWLDTSSIMLYDFS